MPEWWPRMVAARYLHARPWAPIPEAWIGRALAAIEAEEHAREIHQQRSKS